MLLLLEGYFYRTVPLLSLDSGEMIHLGMLPPQSLLIGVRKENVLSYFDWNLLPIMCATKHLWYDIINEFMKASAAQRIVLLHCIPVLLGHCQQGCDIGVYTS